MMRVWLMMVLMALAFDGHGEPVAGATAPDGVKTLTLGAGRSRPTNHPQRGSGADQRSYAELVLSHVGDLSLSDDQVGKITRIQQETRKKMELVGARVRETRRDTHRGFIDPSAEESFVRKRAEAHSASFLELVDAALKARKAINAVLTADQLQRLKSLSR